MREPGGSSHLRHIRHSVTALCVASVTGGGQDSMGVPWPAAKSVAHRIFKFN